MRSIRGAFGLEVICCCLMFLTAPTLAQVTRFHEMPPPKTVAGQKAQRDVRRVQKYVPGELLVRLRSGISQQRSQADHAGIGATLIREFQVVENLQLVRLPEGMAVKDAQRYYRGRRDVLYAEPNYYRFTEQTPVMPNDPRFAEMWSLHNSGQTGGTPGADIHAPEAWSLSTGSADVVVGINDTGVDYTHPDLAANIYRNTADCNSNGVDDDHNGYVDDCYGINTVYRNSNPMDDAGHGTHVAGTIGAAGNNGVGVVGINWQVRIMACKFLDNNGGGTDADAIACLQYFATMKDRGVNLVATNNSWGGGGFSQALLDAIDAQRQRGILFIAAAGNASALNDVYPSYPANYDLPNIIAVAATDHNDALAWFSDFGRRSVHVAAPGQDILSTVPESLDGFPYAVFSGTSMAAPHATGVAALLKAQDPTRDWKSIKNLILAGGDVVPGVADTISQRRLNAYGAMTCANSVVQMRFRPNDNDVYLLPGDTLPLRYLNIRCGEPNGPFSAVVDGGAETIVFADDGVPPDQTAGDGVYAAQRQWLSSEIGDHTLTFSNHDVIAVHVLPALSPYAYTTNVPFNYREIEGTDLQLRDDDSAAIRPPFPIQFGGASFPTVSVNSNGNLTFGSFTQWENSPLPIAAMPMIIAPYWEDLYGSVQWGLTGTAPNRELVVEWRDEMSMGCAWSEYGYPHGRFQVVFFESSSDILFNYADVTFSRLHDPNDDWWGCLWDANAGASATVGVQSTSSVANQFSFDIASLTDQSSILWRAGPVAPSILRLSPFAVLTGASEFTLEVSGRSFLEGAAVRWNGNALPTRFVNGGTLQASIAAPLVATAGTAQVTVSNPNGNGDSVAAAFHIYDAYPVPALTSISPNEVTWGHQTTITVTGSSFVPGSVASWSGTSLGSTPISDTQLQAMVPSNLLALGTAQLAVVNPAPGGGASNTLPVAVVNPRPMIYGAWAPKALGAGTADTTIDILGYDLVRNSVVRWNGSDRPTTITENLHGLTATIFAADLAAPATAELTIFTPAPGGGTSDPLTIAVLSPPANDKIENATLIATAPISLTENPLGATRDLLDPNFQCNPFLNYETVWFTFTPPAGGGFVTADTLGSNYDNFISAWGGTPGNLAYLGCGVNAFNMAVGFPVTSSAPIYYMVSTQYAGFVINNRLVFNLEVGSGFQLDVTPATQNVVRGTPATYTSTVISVFGSYDAPITLECQAVSSDDQWLPCSASPARVTLGGTPASVTISVNTTTAAPLQTHLEKPGQLAPVYALLAFLPVLSMVVAAGGWLRRREAKLGVLLLLVAVLGMQSGCGTGSTKGGRNNPLPSISALNPSSAIVGGPAFTLTVNGANFISSSVVRWNGSDRTTLYVSGSQLRASITAADIASAGTASVTVYNPAPGGGTSNAVSWSTTTGSHSKSFTVYVHATSGKLWQDKQAQLVVTW